MCLNYFFAFLYTCQFAFTCIHVCRWSVNVWKGFFYTYNMLTQLMILFLFFLPSYLFDGIDQSYVLDISAPDQLSGLVDHSFIKLKNLDHCLNFTSSKPALSTALSLSTAVQFQGSHIYILSSFKQENRVTLSNLIWKLETI